MKEDKAIVIQNLSKQYYKIDQDYSRFRFGKKDKSKYFYALKDINININKGEIVGIIGTNGSGKSTLLKIISEVTPPTDGTVEIYGKVASILELGMGFQPDLSGYENIFLSGNLYGLSKKEISENIESIIELFGFPDFIHIQVKYYSSGMYMRLAFAIIVNIKADIYLFDEALNVGDMGFQAKSLSIIANLKQQGKTILVVTQMPKQIINIFDKILVLDKGNSLGYGNPTSMFSLYLNLTNKNAEKDKSINANNYNKIHNLSEVTIASVSLLNSIDDKGFVIFDGYLRIKVNVIYRIAFKGYLWLVFANHENKLPIASSIIEIELKEENDASDFIVKIQESFFTSNNYECSVAIGDLDEKFYDIQESSFTFTTNNSQISKVKDIIGLFNIPFEIET